MSTTNCKTFYSFIKYSRKIFAQLCHIKVSKYVYLLHKKTTEILNLDTLFSSSGTPYARTHARTHTHTLHTYIILTDNVVTQLVNNLVPHLHDHFFYPDFESGLKSGQARMRVNGTLIRWVERGLSKALRVR